MVDDSSWSWIAQHSHWLWRLVQNLILLLNNWEQLIDLECHACASCHMVTMSTSLPLSASVHWCIIRAGWGTAAQHCFFFFLLVAICGIAVKKSLWPSIAFYQQSTIVRVMSVKLLTGHLQLWNWSMITLCVICFIMYGHEYFIWTSVFTSRVINKAAIKRNFLRCFNLLIVVLDGLGLGLNLIDYL